MKPDGGPAFPRPTANSTGQNTSTWNSSQQGMSLRDYFAAAALQGVMAHGHTAPFSAIAVEVYQLADALIAERGKQP